MLTRRDFLTTLLAAMVIRGAWSPSEIRPREDWAEGRPPLVPAQIEEVRFLLVHHSASSNKHTADEVPAIIAGFYDYHTGPSKGWSDVAYNFLVDRFGGVWEGRAGSLAGPVVADATGGNQGFSQLVCLIGDFSQEAPTMAARESLVNVLTWLAERDGLDLAASSRVSFDSRGSNRWAAGETVTTATVAGHRDMSLTTCPGDVLYAYVTGDLWADLEALRRKQGAPTNDRGRRRARGVRAL